MKTVIKKNLKDTKGMTLIEVIVAFAIVAIVGVILVVGFNTMSGLMKEGRTVSRIDSELEQEIAVSEQSSSSENSSFKIPVDGSYYELKGKVKEYKNTEDGEQSFRVFEADE